MAAHDLSAPKPAAAPQSALGWAPQPAMEAIEADGRAYVRFSFTHPRIGTVVVLEIEEAALLLAQLTTNGGDVIRHAKKIRHDLSQRLDVPTPAETRRIVEGG